MNEESDYLGTETWKNHPTLPIEVSTLGRVRMGETILKSVQKEGSYYSRVTIPKVGRWRRHTLVAETWLGWKSGTNLCVCHRDEELPIEIMDSVDNLWIGTRRENAEDRDRKGRLKGKKRNIIPQHVRKQVWAMKTFGLLEREIADILGLTTHGVSNILSRDTDTNVYV